MKQPASIPASVNVFDESALGSWGFFHVGGTYVEETKNVFAQPGKVPLVMRGQMYVEVYVPKTVTRPYPLVFLHGMNQTGLNWMGTPDGRKGWAQYFVEQGYIVYVVDEPGRGRASFLQNPDHASFILSTDFVQRQFTGSTQWPENGGPGTPTFDALCATQNISLQDGRVEQKQMQDAGAALLDKIGEAVLVSHSQGGTFAWLIADARPDLVKGLVQLEPSGPPFYHNVLHQYKFDTWGLTDIPLTYDPPISDPSELKLEMHPSPDANHIPGYLQQEPARQLPNLKGKPTLILTSPSYHSKYDYLTELYLTQAGVENTHLYLQDLGFTGNGHMFILEKNNLEIAEVVEKWMAEHIEA